MFDSAELGHKVSKSQFREMVPALRAALLDAQATLFREKKKSIVLLISGEDGAGKRESIGVLYEWMDPRYLTTLAFEPPTDEERERPAMWRYWRSLPPKGRIGIFAGSWYSDPIRQRINGEITEKELDARAQQINRFEAMLVAEGVVVVKLWIHLSQEGQRKRLESLEKDPLTAWRVTPWNWERLKSYGQLRSVSSEFLRATNTHWAPWTVVEGTDDRYRSLRVAQAVQAALLSTQNLPPAAKPAPEPTPAPEVDHRNVLTMLDLDQKLTDSAYKKALGTLQGRLSVLSRDPRLQQRSVILAFEGADAAGKGGAIRRVSAALDARQFHIVPVAAPTEEELAQPHLWRFWRHLPRRGHLTVFDRTWYGRVLVERVEGFCAPADWQRAYTEINDFEHELVQGGVIVLKFWLQISQEEQLRRFQEREQVAFKRFKITDEDWRNREKWQAYQRAVCDMVERTSTVAAPWTLVEANDKNYARIKILRTLCDHLEHQLAAPAASHAQSDTTEKLKSTEKAKPKDKASPKAGGKKKDKATKGR
jgi:polyphosphate:AMP phosphotransferase